MISLEKYFNNIPIAVQMKVNKKVIEYINKDIKSHVEIFPFGTLNEVLTQKNIIENEIDTVAKEYNYHYSLYSNVDCVRKSEKVIDSEDFGNSVNAATYMEIGNEGEVEKK